MHKSSLLSKIKLDCFQGKSFMKWKKTIKLLISQHQLTKISILNSASNTIDHQNAVQFNKAQLDRSIDWLNFYFFGLVVILSNWSDCFVQFFTNSNYWCFRKSSSAINITKLRLWNHMGNHYTNRCLLTYNDNKKKQVLHDKILLSSQINWKAETKINVPMLFPSLWLIQPFLQK